MEVEQEEANSLTGGETDNGGEESQNTHADLPGTSHIAGPSCIVAGPSYISGSSHTVGPGHADVVAGSSYAIQEPNNAFETSESTDQQQHNSSKPQETDTVNSSNMPKIPSVPETADVVNTPSESALDLEVSSLGTIPERSCISLKEPIEEAVSEELPKDIFDNSSENESVMSGPSQPSLIEEKSEIVQANPIPLPTPDLIPDPTSAPQVEQEAPPVIAPTTQSTSHVDHQPTPTLDTKPPEPSSNQHVEHKPLPAPIPRTEHRPPPLPSISDNKYARITKDVEGVDKRLAEVSDCPNLSLVDKVVITDVTTAKGTITVKECTTDEGFFANNVAPEESQTANGLSLT